MRIIDADRLMQHIKHKLCISSFDYLMGSEKAIINVIESEPSVEMPTWIPCSERLPSEDGWYLIALAFEWGIEYESGRWEDGMWWNPNSHVNVAWMPLPKPWGGADDE